jgi:hypothetical protein
MFLAFIVCVAFVGCVSLASSSHRIEVDDSLLRNMSQGDLGSLIFYLSADQEFSKDDTQNRQSVGRDGILYTNTVHKAKPVKIKKDDTFIFAGNTPGWERVEVKLKRNEDMRLTFVRVNNTNKYELVSAREGTIQLNMPTYQNDKPLLQIKHISGQNPNSSVNNSSLLTPQTKQQTTLNQATPPTGTDSISVLGEGSLKTNDTDFIIEYIRSKNRNIPSYVKSVIITYFIEAETEGVNPDLAIAQMLYHMDFFKNTQRIKANNFGALYQNSRTQYSFKDNETGIQAHIQFLKRSASGNLDSSHTQIVLPLQIWNALADIAGTRYTLDDVSISYRGGNYVSKVKRIDNELHAYVSAGRR